MYYYVLFKVDNLSKAKISLADSAVWQAVLVRHPADLIFSDSILWVNPYSRRLGLKIDEVLVSKIAFVTKQN